MKDEFICCSYSSCIHIYARILVKTHYVLIKFTINDYELRMAHVDKVSKYWERMDTIDPSGLGSRLIAVVRQVGGILATYIFKNSTTSILKHA